MGEIINDPSTGLPLEFEAAESQPEPVPTCPDTPDPEPRKAALVQLRTQPKPPQPKRGRPRGSLAGSKANGAARAQPWLKFFHGDYLGDHKLAQCSLATQGAWMRIICMIAKEGSGSIQIESRALAKLLGGINADTLVGILSELKTTGTADVFKSVTNTETGQLLSGPAVDNPVHGELIGINRVTRNSDVTVWWTVASHRLSREAQAREKTRKRVRKYRALQKRDGI